MTLNSKRGKFLRLLSGRRPRIRSQYVYVSTVLLKDVDGLTNKRNIDGSTNEGQSRQNLPISIGYMTTMAENIIQNQCSFQGSSSLVLPLSQFHFTSSPSPLPLSPSHPCFPTVYPPPTRPLPYFIPPPPILFPSPPTLLTLSLFLGFPLRNQEQSFKHRQKTNNIYFTLPYMYVI